MSNLSALEYIQNRSEATTGLFNQRLSVISANFAALNSAQTISFPSGNTLSVFSSLDASGNLHAGNRIGVGPVPSADTVEVLTIGADSSKSDYILFHDPTGARSSYVIGSRVGGTADGLNIYDASGSTMIASFSKQSIRFFQKVVGPVFDVGGALADTYNAATFGTGADSLESRIQSAINQASIDGVSRVYVPANMYPYSASSVSFINSVQMVREGGNWSVYDVLAYGARGNGIASDRSAAQAAINGLPTSGGRLIFSSNKTYFLGPASGNVNLLDFSTKNNVTVEATGAALTCQTTGLVASISHMVYHSEVSGFYWTGGTLSDGTGFNMSVTTLGTHGFNLFNSTHTGGQIVVENTSGVSLLVFFQIPSGVGGSRTRQIGVHNCSASVCYYGVATQENGDSLRVTNFVTKDVRRSVIIYGLQGADLDIVVERSSAVTLGADAAIEIMRQTRDTTNIRARVLYSGVAGHTNAVAIDHQSSTGSGVLSNIDVQLDYANVTPAGTMRPFRMQALDAGGSEITLNTSNHWNNIKLAGTFDGWSVQNARYNNSAPIYMVVSQYTEGRITLDPSMGPWMTYRDGLHFPNFAIIRGTAGDILRTRSGAGVVNSAFTIPTVNLNAFGGIAFRVKVTAVDDYSANTAQNMTVREDVVIAYNPSGGNAVIQEAANVYNVVQGSAASVTYGVSGENLTVQLSGSAYSNVSAWAWCEARQEGSLS